MALLLMLGAVIFASCGTQTKNDVVTLRFSTWGSAEEMVVLNSLLNTFEAKHPHIHIQVLHIPENYFQKLHILIAGGLTPDVVFMNSLSLPVYADNNIFLPLESFLGKPQSPLNQKTFFEPALKALSWKEHLYAIPRDVSDLVVYYNADLFKQAGLLPPKPNWTLQEMLVMAQKLTRDTNGDGVQDQFGISFYAKPPLFWLPFVWSTGGHLFNPGLTQFQLNQPKAVQALQFYGDLRNRWHVAPRLEEVGSATMSQLFLQGKLAMMVSGRWSVPILRKQAKFHWDVVPFPQGNAGSVVGVDASGYAISKVTQHPQESWELVQFLSSHHAQQIFSQSGLIVPARIDVAQSAGFLKNPPAHGRYFISVIAQGQPSHTPVRWDEISEELDLALEPVWEGTTTAKQAIESVSPKIEKLLQ